MTLKSANEALEKNVENDDLVRFAYIDLLAYVATFFIKYRFENKLTQKDLAKRLEISQVMVSKIENGKWNFSMEKLNKYVQKLDEKLSLKIELHTIK
ncbi:MAG: helix-turn-helix transcriptional regulator [Thermotogae bacterium]|jgi:DNA-binding XRE family transcriptional regulator|nr:helix-turn-helix transcriptional regulator [Thermotogota bacterium]